MVAFVGAHAARALAGRSIRLKRPSPLKVIIGNPVPAAGVSDQPFRTHVRTSPTVQAPFDFEYDGVCGAITGVANGTRTRNNQNHNLGLYH